MLRLLVTLVVGKEEEAVREGRKEMEAHIGHRLCPGTMTRERTICYLRDFFFLGICGPSCLG